jgi:hypothetical protein
MANSTPQYSEQLAGINQKILAEGASLPRVQLQDGSMVHTGTVAAMLYNVQRYNQGQRGSVERELELAVPTLFKVGLFELFTPQEWCDASNPGRGFVGECARAWLAPPAPPGV